ncbi:MAG: HEAT repeat domain-containing protein [Anaerolineae bacterium]|nr:HEAT repeat domain-containing protein [Anaerolineae bacterium]
MGGPIPERLREIVAEREAALQRLHDQIAHRAAPLAVARQARVRRRNWAIVAVALAAILVIAGLLVSGGAFSGPEPTPTVTPVPTVDVAALPQPVTDAINQLQNDPDPGKRAIAAKMLGADRFREYSLAAVEPLIAALQDEAFEVRAAAAWALGKIGDPRAIEPLQVLLRDNYSPVRDAAAEALMVGFDMYCSDAEGCKPKGALH